MKGIKFMSAALLYLAALSGTAFAQDAAFDLPLASSAYVKDYESFKLAANDSGVLVKKSSGTAPEIKKSEFEPATFSGSNAHKYLGLATIAGAIITGALHRRMAARTARSSSRVRPTALMPKWPV